MTAIKQFAFTKAQVSKLMAMQDQLNTYIHPEWKSQGFDWETAVNDECLEILGHLGWKWWKDKTYKQGVTEQNKAQIKLELIDILHFILSQRIETGACLEDVTNWLNGSYNDYEGLYELTKHLQSSELNNDAYEFEIWADMCRTVELIEIEILETYTQKYVLNKFRQDHGYKDGSYVKVWTSPVDGMPYEDNEFLAELVEDAKVLGEDSTDETALYNALELGYNSRLNK